MRLWISLFLFLSLCAKLNAQEISSQDSIYIKSAENLIEKYLKNETKGHKYVLFAIEADIYLILIEQGNFYDEYYINRQAKLFIIKSHKIDNEKKELFDKVFNKDTYNIDLFDYTNYGTTLAEGRPSYFYFSDYDSKKYGETLLSLFTKPTPIDEDVYDFLLKTMILNISSYHQVRHLIDWNNF